MRRSRIVLVALVVAVLTTFGWASAMPAFGETPINISNRSNEDYEPAVCGDRVAWRGYVESGQDIFTWAAGDTTATDISNQPGIEAGVGVSTQGSADLVMWYGYGAPNDVYVWTPGAPTPINLSNNPGVQDYMGDVSGNRMVWQQWDGYDYDVYTWYYGDPMVPAKVGYAWMDNRGPQVSGDRIAWTAYDYASSQWDIYTWAVGDSKPTNVSNNAANDSYVQVSGNRIVWRRQVPTGQQVWTCLVGGTPACIYNTNYSNAFYPQISGECITWLGYDEHNYQEVFVWSPETGRVNVSNNGPVSDGHPDISDGVVVWVSSQNYGDVFAWTFGDKAPTNISNDIQKSEGNPKISGRRLVWEGHTYAQPSNEIYTVKLNEPTATAMTGTSGTRTTSYNAATTVYADVKADGAPVTGKAPYLEVSPNGATGWTRVNATITEPQPGRYQASVRRTSTGYFRFGFDGGLRYLPSAGPKVKVYPKVRLTRSTSWTTLYRYRTYYASGYIEPRHTSANGKVVIRAYKRMANGKYPLYPTRTFSAKSTYIYYKSTKTKYRVPVALPSRGYWKLVAYHAGDAANAATLGSPDYVVVK